MDCRDSPRPAEGPYDRLGKTMFFGHVAFGGIFVKNPLDSLWGTVISGFILTAILYYVAKMIVGSSTGVGG